MRPSSTQPTQRRVPRGKKGGATYARWTPLPAAQKGKEDDDDDDDDDNDDDRSLIDDLATEYLDISGFAIFRWQKEEEDELQRRTAAARPHDRVAQTPTKRKRLIDASGEASTARLLPVQGKLRAKVSSPAPEQAATRAAPHQSGDPVWRPWSTSPNIVDKPAAGVSSTAVTSSGPPKPRRPMARRSKPWVPRSGEMTRCASASRARGSMLTAWCTS